MAGRMGGLDTGCAYSVSKAAMIGLTMRVARRVASEGVTVNAIAPGPTNTALVQGFTPEVLKRLIDGIPVGRVIEPQRVGETVAFLASDAAEFITGAVIDINGGMFIG
jgi:3-oxoacyl-[acyl-carrier protein] reductase